MKFLFIPAALLILLFPYKNFAQPGSLDQSFANNGIGKYSIPLQMEISNAKFSLTQSDGKILIGGIMNNLLSVVRLKADGSADNSYGTEGKIIINDGGLAASYNAAAIQQDNKIIIAGSLEKDTYILRLNTDGSLDKSFDLDGKLIVNVNAESDGATAIAIQSDGKIVVAGYSDNGTGLGYEVIRINSDGTLDATFDADGKKEFTVSTDMSDRASGVAVLPNGKIVIAGTGKFNGDNDFTVIRLNVDGSFDAGFSKVGKTHVNVSPINGQESATALAVDVSGNIIVSGYAEIIAGQVDFAAIRLKTNGSLDNTFDGDGKALISIDNNSDFSTAMQLQTDGKIVMAGYTSTYDYAVLRLNTNGSPDIAFDGDGKKTIDVFNTDICSAISIFSDGKILLAGFSEPSISLIGARYYSAVVLKSNGNLNINFDVDGKKTISAGMFDDVANAVAINSKGLIIAAGQSLESKYSNYGNVIKLKVNGTPDNSFDADGKTLITGAGNNTQTKAVLVQPDDKILIAGSSLISVNDSVFSVSRLNTNGSPDLSFGENGTQTIDVTGISTAKCIALQPDGKIMVAGYSTGSNGARNMTIVRLTSSGILDNSFNGNGQKIITYSFSSVANAIAIQLDGKILVAGNTQTINKGFGSEVTAVRLNSDGSLDNSFGSNGRTIISNRGNDYCYAMSLQSNGRIVLGGTNLNGTTYDFLAIRLTAAGVLDNNFDGDGKNIIPLGIYDDIANGMALQADGKIILAGYSFNGTDNDASIVRLKTNGSLDNSFDGDGKIIFNYPGTDEIINAVAIQADGKIVLAGKQKNLTGDFGNKIFVMRLLGDNTLTTVAEKAEREKASNSLKNISLQQNAPNPFSNTTTINYSLPQTYSLAKIIVIDKAGKVLKNINISGSGKGSLNINTSTLISGTYNYSLYIDGRLIDTKQMVSDK